MVWKEAFQCLKILCKYRNYHKKKWKDKLKKYVTILEIISIYFYLYHYLYFCQSCLILNLALNVFTVQSPCNSLNEVHQLLLQVRKLSSAISLDVTISSDSRMLICLVTSVLWRSQENSLIFSLPSFYFCRTEMISFFIHHT